MKYAIVTGSTKGIGKAIGTMFLKQGHYVIFNYASDDEAADKLEKELIEYKNSFCIIKQKLNSLEGVEEFAQKCKEITDKIDALVLNAGVTDKTAWSDISWQQWNEVMDVNLNVPAFLAQKIGGMLKNEGNIIFIGALMGQYPHSVSIPYGVSKAGLHFLAKCLVKEYAERKIRINVVAPGFVETPWQDNKLQDHKDRINQKTAIGRFAAPQEIADAVWFVAQNGYINGTVVDINGGYLYK